MSIYDREKIYTSYNTITMLGLHQKAYNAAKAFERILVIDNDDENFIKTMDGHIVSVIGDIGEIDKIDHPVVLNNVIYIDCRSYYSKGGTLKSKYENDFLYARAIYEYLWLSDSEIFFPQMNFMVDAFSTWASNALAREQVTSILVQSQYRILLAIYYSAIFSNDHYHSKEDLVLYLLKLIPKITGLPQQLLLDLLEMHEETILALYMINTPELKTSRIELLCEVFNGVFEGGILFQPYYLFNAICRGSIIMANGVAIATIGMEHPPTFCAMLSLSLDRNEQNKTALGRAVMSISRRNNPEHFKLFLKEHSK